MNLTRVITDIQKELVRQGHRVEVDGLAGPETWGAIYSELLGHNIVTVETPVGRVDERSEKVIATLHPKVQPYARALVQQAKAQNINIKVTSGTRTYDEQNALYAQGRTKPGKVVTNARGGQSWHNHSVAFDITVFRGSEPVYESPAYAAVGALGRQMGLEWGGDWTSLKDEPHFQMRNHKSLAQARELHDQGKDVFA